MWMDESNNIIFNYWIISFCLPSSFVIFIVLYASLLQQCSVRLNVAGHLQDLDWKEAIIVVEKRKKTTMRTKKMENNWLRNWKVLFMLLCGTFLLFLKMFICFLFWHGLLNFLRADIYFGFWIWKEVYFNLGQFISKIAVISITQWRN